MLVREKNCHTKIPSKTLLGAIMLFFAGGVIGFFLPLGELGSEGSSGASFGEERTIDVRFSPKGGCTALIVDAVDRAQQEIYVAAYSLTSVPIVDALLRAKGRGVKVYFTIDRGRYEKQKATATQVNRLAGQVDRLLVDTRSSYAHNKVMVIDKRCVISGSFNFDKNAEEKNRENVVCIHNDLVLAALYIKNWHDNANACSKRGKKTPYCKPIEVYWASQKGVSPKKRK